MEANVLLWIHARAEPWLDTLFRFSHELGVQWPSEVVAGWTLGALQTYVAVRDGDRRRAELLHAGRTS